MVSHPPKIDQLKRLR